MFRHLARASTAFRKQALWATLVFYKKLMIEGDAMGWVINEMMLKQLAINSETNPSDEGRTAGISFSTREGGRD